MKVKLTILIKIKLVNNSLKILKEKKNKYIKKQKYKGIKTILIRVKLVSKS